MMFLPAIITDAPSDPETTPDQARYGVMSVGVQHAVHIQNIDPFNRPATDSFVTIIPAKEGDPAMLMNFVGQWVAFIFTERIKFAQCEQSQAITGPPPPSSIQGVQSDAF